MSKLTFAILVAFLSVSAGCGRSSATAKATAERLFHAYRKGDTPAILEHIRVPDWERAYWDDSRKVFSRNRGFRYKVLSTVVEGDRATVTLKVKEEKDAEWVTREMPLRKMAGSWTTGLEEFVDVTGATILTRGESDAKGTAQRLVNAYKNGDAATICDHIDFKSIYDMMPPMARQNQSFEDFEKSCRKQMEYSFEEERNEEWNAHAISAEEKEDTATVKMKIKPQKDAEWKEVDVPFRKVDGKWKLGLDGLAAMSGEEIPEMPETPEE